jgi:hypothetical protein
MTKGAKQQQSALPRPTFDRGLGLFDSVMIVSGIMIGSGIFIVSAGMLRRKIRLWAEFVVCGLSWAVAVRTGHAECEAGC